MSTSSNDRANRAINVYQSILLEKSAKSQEQQEAELRNIHQAVQETNSLQTNILNELEDQKNRAQKQTIITNHLNYQLKKMDIINQCKNDDVRQFFYQITFKYLKSDIEEKLITLEDIQVKDYLENKYNEKNNELLLKNKSEVGSESISLAIKSFDWYQKELAQYEDLINKDINAPLSINFESIKRMIRGVHYFYMLLLTLLFILIFISFVGIAPFEPTTFFILLIVTFVFYYLKVNLKKEYLEKLTKYYEKVKKYDIETADRSAKIDSLSKELDEHPFKINLVKASDEFDEINSVNAAIEKIDRDYNSFLENLSK